MVSQKSLPADFLVVGRVTKPHGLAGYVEVLSLTDNPERFAVGNSFMLNPPVPEAEQVTIVAAKRKKGRHLLLFDNVSKREDIEGYVGRELTIPAHEAQKPADAYWIHELVGCVVVTVAGASLGTVSDVLTTGGNDVYVVAGAKTYYIPAIGQVIKEIDIERRRIVIDPLPGLLEL